MNRSNQLKKVVTMEIVLMAMSIICFAINTVQNGISGYYLIGFLVMIIGGILPTVALIKGIRKEDIENKSNETSDNLAVEFKVLEKEIQDMYGILQEKGDKNALEASKEKVLQNINELAHYFTCSEETLENVTSSIKVIGNETTQVENIVEMCIVGTTGTGNNMKEALGQIDDIEKYSKDTKNAICGLVESNKDISTTLTIINSIAEETNLLALNASIEAAHAGESGRGFAIVAQEIKKLAEQTTQSAEYIGNVIGAVIKRTQECMKAIEMTNQSIVKNKELISQTSKAVDEMLGLGAEAVGKTSQSTQIINELVDKVQDMSNQLSQSAYKDESFSNAIHDITDYVDDVHHVIQEGTSLMDKVVGSIHKIEKNL